MPPRAAHPRRTRRRLAAVLLTTIAATSCGSIEGDEFNDELRRRGSGFEAQAVAEGVDELGTELGASDVRLARVIIQPPANRYWVHDADGGPIVEWRWGTSLAGPTELPPAALDEVGDTGFGADDLPDADRLEEIFGEAVASAGFDDAWVSGALIQMRGGELTTDVSVRSSDDDHVTIRFGGDGTQEVVE